MPRREAKPFADNDLGAILDALPIGLYLVDRDLRVVAWNRLREEGPFGRPRAQAVGRPLRQVLGAAGYRTAEPLLRSVLASGRASEDTVETAAGGLFHVRRLPVRRGGKVTHVLSWFEDITERRAMEMRLIASDRLAFLGQLVVGRRPRDLEPARRHRRLRRGPRVARRPRPRAATRARPSSSATSSASEVARCEAIVRFLLDSARAGDEETRRRRRHRVDGAAPARAAPGLRAAPRAGGRAGDAAAGARSRPTRSSRS